MKKNSVRNTVILLVIAIAICVVPLVVFTNSEFGGTDDAAEQMALQIDKNYKPWFEHFWTPPGSEVESLLFALQAALGSGVLFGGLGYLFGVRKREEKQTKGKEKFQESR